MTPSFDDQISKHMEEFEGEHYKKAYYDGVCQAKELLEAQMTAKDAEIRELKDKIGLERRAVEHLENFGKRIERELTAIRAASEKLVEVLLRVERGFSHDDCYLIVTTALSEYQSSIALIKSQNTGSRE